MLGAFAAGVAGLGTVPGTHQARAAEVPTAAATSRDGDLIGVPTAYTTHDQETLLDIARRYDVGYVALRNANPGVDPWLPGSGTVLRIPTQHILPPGPRRGIVINLPELRLYYYGDGKQPPRSFPIGIGDEGKATPVAQTRVVRKIAGPSWTPTASERAEDPQLPQTVGPGPDNPMGDYALYLGLAGYAIHGSNKPDSIGRRDSHGCIRMYPEDIALLYQLVTPGTPVRIIDQQAKAGWADDRLYLEVHPAQDDVNAIETHGRPQSTAAVDAEAILQTAAGAAAAARIDWDLVLSLELQRNGLPTPVLSIADPAAP